MVSLCGASPLACAMHRMTPVCVGNSSLFGTAVEAARSFEGIFTSSFFVLCFHVGECPVDPMRMRVGSIMKLDQKSNSQSQDAGGRVSSRLP